MFSQLTRPARVKVMLQRGVGSAGLITAGAFTVLIMASPATAQVGGEVPQSGTDSRALPTIGHEAPTGDTMFEFDPFRSFTDCLAAAAHPDSRYPGIDPAEVNACLGL